MKTLQRYIGLTVVNTIGLVVLLLVGLFLFVLVVGELRHIGKGNYGLWQVIQFVLLSLPQQIYLFFPMAGLIGSLLGLGTLASHSELIVMRAAGTSLGQIIWAVMKYTFVLVVFVTILGETITPRLQAIAVRERKIAKKGIKSLVTKHGIWAREGNTYIHIDSTSAQNHLHGVWIFKFNKQKQLVMSTFAKTASYHHKHWLLSDISKTRIQAGSTTNQHIAKQRWNVSFNPDMLGISTRINDPEAMSLYQLKLYINYMKHNNLQANDFQLSFWQRLFQPLATAVMIFLAIPFIFGPLRTVPMGLRILTGAFFGFSFYLLNQFFGPFSLVYQIPPVLAALSPTLLFALIAYLLMLRVR